MTDREQLCKEFTELTGGHWHECRWDNTVKVYKCLECELTSGTPIQNSTYENHADVLRVMMQYPAFIGWMGGDIEYDGTALIPVNCIIEPDALLKAAVEWMK